jgi:hypothetical protein
MKQESMNHWSPESRDFSRGEVQYNNKYNINSCKYSAVLLGSIIIGNSIYKDVD